MSQFTIESAHPVRVEAAPDQPISLLNRGDTVYYGQTSQVSSTSNDGSLASGVSIELTIPTWIRSASSSLIETEFPAPIEAPQPVFYVDDQSGDDVTRARAAYAAAVGAGGGDVVFGPRLYSMNHSGLGSVITLTRDNAGTQGRIRIRGEGATIKLSTNTPRFVDFNKVADHDTFRNVEICDLEIDANNVTGSHHVVIGTAKGGTNDHRINIEDVAVRRVRAYNIASTSSGGNRRNGFHIFPAHATIAEGTQNWLKRITFEDCRAEGGCYGFAVAALTDDIYDSANYYLDEITFRRCYHSPGGATAIGNNFHIAGAGFGGSCLIEDCVGELASDTAIEVDAMTTAVIRGCKTVDPVAAHTVIRNFRSPEYPDEQVITWEDHTAQQLTRDIDTTNQAYAFTISLTSTSSETDIGHVRIINCTHEIQTPMTDVVGHIGHTINSINTSLRRLTVRDLKINAPNLAFNPAGNVFPSWIAVLPARHCRTSIHGLQGYFAGSNSGGTKLNLRGLIFEGDHTLDLSGIDLDYQVTGLSSGKFDPLRIGVGSSPLATSTIDGRIAGLKLIGVTDDTAPTGVNIGGTSPLTIPSTLLFQACDFSALPVGATEFRFQATSNASKVQKIAHTDRDGNQVTLFQGSLGLNGVTPVAQSTGWSVTNVTLDKVYDANATSTDELADVLGTLITYLISRGDISA